VEKPVNTAYLTMGFPSVSLTDPDLYPLDVLAVVLGRGASSRLYRRLREKEELVTGVSAYSVTPSYGPGHFQILATLPPEKQAAAQAVILEELENIKSTAPAAEELEKAKRVLASDHVFTQETIEGQAAQIGTDDLLTGDPDFSQRYIERIQRVTLEDVRRVARQYLNPDVLCLVAVRPPVPEKTEAVAAPEKSEISRSTLDNGIVLLLRENHAAPTVTMIAAFTGGVRFETDQTNGLSSLTADLLVKGTKKRSAAQIAEAVDSLGARLTPISGKNSIGCALEVLSQDFDAGLNLLNEVLTEPTFPEEEVAKEKRLALSSLAERKDSPFFIASRLLQENYFTGHPYRLDPLGNETSLPTLTRDDIVRFHDQHCVPGKMVLAIFGDFDAEAARSKVAQAFASLPPAKPVEVSLPPQEPPASTQEIVRQKEGIEQAVIYVGLPGGTLGDDDVYAVDVLDAVLSGVSIPGGRLHNRLRGSGAQLVYAVHAYNSPGLEPGMFVIYAATEPSLKDKVLSAIREEVERMRTEEVPADELERGKMMCISSYQISRQANAGQAQSAAYDELYDLGYDRSLHYPERIEQVTPQQVLLAAQRHLDLLHAVIVEVIPAAKQ
jgi:zinc protease